MKDKLKRYKRIIKQEFDWVDWLGVAYILYLIVMMCLGQDKLLLYSLAGVTMGFFFHMLRR